MELKLTQEEYKYLQELPETLEKLKKNRVSAWNLYEIEKVILEILIGIGEVCFRRQGAERFTNLDAYHDYSLEQNTVYQINYSFNLQNHKPAPKEKEYLDFEVVGGKITYEGKEHWAYSMSGYKNFIGFVYQGDSCVYSQRMFRSGGRLVRISDKGKMRPCYPRLVRFYNPKFEVIE